MVHMSAARLTVIAPEACSGEGASRSDTAPQLTRGGAIPFSDTVRCVVALSRRGGLDVPVFRSPPGRVGVDRTIRRRGERPPVVAIARSGRPLAAVQSDVIEAVVVVNSLDDRRADRFRRAAWGELERAGLTPSCVESPVAAATRAGYPRVGPQPSRTNRGRVQDCEAGPVPGPPEAGDPERVAS